MDGARMEFDGDGATPVMNSGAAVVDSVGAVSSNVAMNAFAILGTPMNSTPMSGTPMTFATSTDDRSSSGPRTPSLFIGSQSDLEALRARFAQHWAELEADVSELSLSEAERAHLNGRIKQLEQENARLRHRLAEAEMGLAMRGLSGGMSRWSREKTLPS